MIDNPILNRKIKTVLIGCGRIANKHFSAIQEHHNDIELVAICDIDKKALNKAEQLPSVTRFEHYQEMLEQIDCDLVVVTTPSGLHVEHTCLAALHGKHIITEKPIATTVKDGLRMIDACQKNNVQLFVVKQNRLNPTVQAVKQAIDAGRFGEIYTVIANVLWTRPQTYYDQADWRGTWKMDGGALMNQASHYIDLLEWLIGPVEAVQAMTSTLARNIEAEDTAMLNLKWQNGALGSVSVSMLTYPKNLEGSITILGETGTVRLDGIALNEIKHWQFADDGLQKQDIEQLSYQTSSVYGNGHSLYYDNVIKTLRGEAEPITDGNSGLKSLKLLEAIYQSAKQNKCVNLVEGLYELSSA